MEENNKVKKLSRWKQGNPKDQMTSILMSLEGWIYVSRESNEEKKCKLAINKIEEHLEELKIIRDNYVSLEW